MATKVVTNQHITQALNRAFSTGICNLLVVLGNIKTQKDYAHVENHGRVLQNPFFFLIIFITGATTLLFYLFILLSLHPLQFLIDNDNKEVKVKYT